MRQIQTKVTQMLGIQYPIIQGAMQWIAKAPLAAAVSEAGGLGIISSSSFPDPEQMRQELQKAKELTDKPLAVNLSIFPSLNTPDYPGYIRVAAEEGIRIIETAGRAPDAYIAQMKDCGMTVMHKCTTVKHAKKAQDIGCDIVVIDGFESAGHPGENDIGTMVLTPRAVEELAVPVICCGGISNGRGLAAALMLGAGAVTMGTRFLVTKECGIREDVKQYIAEHITEMDTMLLLRAFTNTSRVYRNKVAEEIWELEKSGATFEKIGPLMSGKRGYEMMFETGDMDYGTLSIGLSAGLVHDIPTVRDLIDRTMEECCQAIAFYA